MDMAHLEARAPDVQALGPKGYLARPKQDHAFSVGSKRFYMWFCGSQNKNLLKRYWACQVAIGSVTGALGLVPLFWVSRFSRCSMSPLVAPWLKYEAMQDADNHDPWLFLDCLFASAL